MRWKDNNPQQRSYHVYIAKVDQSIISLANAHDTQLSMPDRFQDLKKTATVLELADAVRYPPRTPWDLHGRLVR
jgi:hypothetical protein